MKERKERKSRRNTNRTLLRLRSQHKYYISTLKDMKSLLSDYEIEWARDYATITSYAPVDKKDSDLNHTDLSGEFSKVEIPSFQDEIEAATENNHVVNSPEWAKSLYRKIVKETHPDRIKDVERKDKMKLFFQSAATSIESGDYDKLIDIAINLDIDVKMPPADMIKKLSSRIESLKIEIEKIEQSLPWVWGESYGIEEIRSGLVENILKKKLKNSFSQEKIREIILDIESE